MKASRSVRLPKPPAPQPHPLNELQINSAVDDPATSLAFCDGLLSSPDRLAAAVADMKHVCGIAFYHEQHAVDVRFPVVE